MCKKKENISVTASKKQNYKIIAKSDIIISRLSVGQIVPRRNGGFYENKHCGQTT